ncbi:hypothetical protein Pla108_14010 [Botrimarina colliarenosi]|uniref:Uncharacterized protein n=1 Tax=Botrimarina colliarenosi TaxID=2528001 RepID=A0A5C6ALD0_9BACT|nr:hypothetical protein [Botrimarina colliarenosi]TWU00450.1 hypothetical protein Pla108_14010 [Botrimarina colliarenosi]
MFTHFRIALVLATAICSSTVGQSTQSGPYWPSNEPYYGPQRPLSATGAWRYDQSVREFYHALGSQNQLSAELNRFEIGTVRSEARFNRDANREIRTAQARERLHDRRHRQDAKALQLLEAIEDAKVVWPTAFQNPWAKRRLRDVCDALGNSYATLGAKEQLSEIRSALSQGQLADSRLERDRAFRVLVLLERLVAIKQLSSTVLN